MSAHVEGWQRWSPLQPLAEPMREAAGVQLDGWAYPGRAPDTTTTHDGIIVNFQGGAMLLVKDQDAKKGTVEMTFPVESDLATPNDPGLDPNHPGLDDLGLPNDPVAIAQDVEGANEDESQG